jgi:D-threo-aldose 1-dehydrogenase
MATSFEPAEPRALGSRGVEVTRLSLGCGPLGQMFELVPDAQAVATVETAYSSGIRYFDTAPLYGVGTSEQRAGAALRTKPRDEFVLSTKVGRVLVPARDAPAVGLPKLAATFDFTRDGVLRSLEASLERTGLDRVDILHVHDPDDHMEVALEETIPTLRELCDQGVIRAVSAGMNHAAPLGRIVREAGVDAVLLAGRYTLLDQSALGDLLPLCAEKNVGFIAAGVVNSGILADPHDRAPFFYRPAPPEVVARAQAMQAVCARYGVSLVDAALQFPFGHPAVTTVLIGSRSPDEITRNIASVEVSISDDLWAELKAEGLLGADVPTPVAGS